MDDRLCLSIFSAFRQRQIKSFQHAIHGRVFLRKGDSPRFAADLFTELSILWKTSSPWQVIPLGKGYFTLKFLSPEDYALAFAKSAWRLRVGILFLQAWTPNFNPNKIVSSTAQVWVRIFNLPHKFWHPEVLSGIARHVGTPILVDGMSARASVGYFARVLVEMNVALDIPQFLDVKCDDDIYEIEFGYENLPYFCCLCSAIGHATDDCKLSSGKELASPTKQTEQDNSLRGRKHRSRSRKWKKTRNRSVTNRQRANEGPSSTGLDNDAESSPRREYVTAGKNSMEKSNRFEVLEGRELENGDNMAARRDDSISGPDSVLDWPIDAQDSKEDTAVMEVSNSPVVEEIIADDREAVSPAARSQREDRTGSEVIVVVPSTDMADDSASRLVIEPTHSAQEELASRISRLEEQVSQGMQMLVDNPKRRPSRSKKGMERLQTPLNPIDSIKSRLRNADDPSMRVMNKGAVLDTPSPVEFLNKVHNAQSGGALMQNFVVHSSPSDAARAMSAVVSKRWGDMLDDEESFNEDDLMFS
ncbi:uncharacterized protein LOC131023495 [Salvia miltiorrhiza]|uniref:uncharacterized protein LOC131023495 n=1 Tax=Salvia miltiorrhiza TaxID=226208 RepID=UPI0025AC1D46|nr:uncharacterized protein LOC131023495 [Salvia miltiorrhiza]